MALTVRLTEEENRKLALIIDHMEIKTASGAIKNMISKYMETERTLESAWNKIDSLEEKLNKFETYISHINQAKKAIEITELKLFKLI